MATPLWPGDNFSFDTPLPDLLSAFLPMYSELLTRGPINFDIWTASDCVTLTPVFVFFIYIDCAITVSRTFA